MNTTTALTAAALLLLAAATPTAAAKARDAVSLTITPAASGRQRVRVLLPLPRGFLQSGHGLTATGAVRTLDTAVCELTALFEIAAPLRNAVVALSEEDRSAATGEALDNLHQYYDGAATRVAAPALIITGVA